MNGPADHERFARLERLVGKAGLMRLQQAHVAVVGLGAVGSYAVEGLARAGVGRLSLVDFDVVRRSNLNRQLLALESTLGHPKVDVARARVRDINPDCVVEGWSCFVHRESVATVLAGPPDVIIDAIDSLAPKVELLAEVLRRHVPVISSMGAAWRTDPSQVRTGPLSGIDTCPLARLIRKRLRRFGLPVSCWCVYSTERIDRHFPEPELTLTVGEDDELQRGRTRRTLGSLSTLTGIFGLTAANLALQMILGRIPAKPLEIPGPAPRSRH